MAVIKLPDMDAVTTKTDIVNYFKALLRAFSDIVRHLAMDAGMLKAMLKARDERQNTKFASITVRPMLWAIMALYTVQKGIKLCGSRVYTNYGSQIAKRSPGHIDWDS